MLVVTVEILPGGDASKRKIINVMTAANVSKLASLSDYMYSIDGSEEELYVGHDRSKGAWELIQNILINEDKLKRLRKC